ncbi:MAG: sensor histidine kinase [bacterium]
MNYFLWALLTPLIFYFSRKFQFDQKKWPLTVCILFVLGLMTVVAHTAIYEGISIWGRLNAEQNLSISHLISNHFLPILPVKFLIFSAMLGAGYAFDYYKHNREQIAKLNVMEKQLVQAKLETLKAQLQPHFLFNTLNAISALVENDPVAARRMIARLSELLRLALDSKERHEITLGEEIAILMHYLEIEKIRFHEKLKLNIQVSKEAQNALMPNMILQPLVENAIRHGVAKKRSGGTIYISAKRDNSMLKVAVQDDGPGLPKKQNEANDQGIGLANTRSRLEQLYGDEQTFELIDLNGQGLRVCFTIPFLQKPSDILIDKNMQQTKTYQPFESG